MNKADQILNCLQSIEKFNEISGFLKVAPNGELEYNLLKEEVLEFFDAHNKKDITGVRDALADIFVVLYGTILKFGLKDEFWAILSEVCYSNLTKFCYDKEEAEESVRHYIAQGVDAFYDYNFDLKVYVIKRRDGKTLKSINFVKPRL